MVVLSDANTMIAGRDLTSVTDVEIVFGKFLGAVQRGRGQLASASPERTSGGSAQFTEITT